MSEQQQFSIELEQLTDLEFKVKFDMEQVSDLLVDEPEPVGRGAGPNASRLLAAAVGNCLTASLIFCARKARAELAGVRTEVTGSLGRNEAGRFRIQGMAVRIHLPALPESRPEAVERCLSLFEDYCVVTASVRQGIPVRVEVLGREGERLFAGGTD